MKLRQTWAEQEFVAFDLETTGPYPMTAEICEIGAVRWKAGQVLDTFQTLVRPGSAMTEDNIAIHGITNEMVASSPSLHEILDDFLDFIRDGVIVGHHVQFDMGFVAHELEKISRPLPSQVCICSSLLSRKILPESPNHRLQTLVRHLELPIETAHRAYEDALSCMRVAAKCFERLGEQATLGEIVNLSSSEIKWSRYSLLELLRSPLGKDIESALASGDRMRLKYKGGSRPGRERIITPLGLVRNINGDFLVGHCWESQQKKRYYWNKIVELALY